MAKSLLQPLQFGDLTLQNRFALAPLTRGRSDEAGVPNALMALYYVQRSSAGLIITEGTFVSEEARGFLNAPGIFNAAQVAEWKKVTSAVKAHNPRSVMFVQLWHTGRASHRHFQPDNEPPRGTSAIGITTDRGVHTKHGKQQHETPREMTLEDIKKTVKNFQQAAQNAKDAGFDGVEIHGANGYIVDTFLQSKSNQRSDEYGGSVENRARFLLEIVEAVSTVFPPSRIIVRISPNGMFNDMGSDDYREQFTHVATVLNGKVGTIEVMDGLAFGFHNKGEPFTAREVRNAFKGFVISNCGHTFESGEDRLASGDADIVSFGRPFITTPDLVERYQSGAALNEAPDAMATWYVPGERGYTDYKDLRSPQPRL